MNKDIVLITSAWKMSGVYRIESELTREWQRQGHRVSIINANGRIMHDALNAMKIQSEKEEPRIKPITLINRFFRLIWFFHIHKSDTIVALSITADCFAALFGLLVRNKVVISERNDPSQYPESHTYRKFRDFCFRFADVCVFQTDDARAYFSTSIQKKGVVIPNPINDDIPEFDAVQREKVVMSTGRLKAQKNFPMLIRAFAEFSKQFPEYRLKIYGDGELLDELKQLADSLDIINKVDFEGFNDDIYPLMASASIFVMSSNYEGISNAMLEALAIGVPTICTDCPAGGARQMIEDGINGLLVPVGDVKALQEAMQRVASDEGFAATLGQNGKLIRKKYPLDRIASMWIEVM